MKLSIKNVGKLKEADVEINGITVIAGENNTGKSTVSKTLFSLFNGFYNFDNKMLELKSGDIRNIFLRFIKNLNRENSNILIDIPDKIVKDTSYKFDRNKLIKLIQENRNFISIEYLGEVSEKIFDIFERERTDSTAGVQGTGLGMSIVKRLVDACLYELIRFSGSYVVIKKMLRLFFSGI